MQVERIHQTLTTITEALSTGATKKALRLARQLARDMLASPPVDPELFGWARFYEIKCLYCLEQYPEALEVLETEPPVEYAMTAKNVAWLFSVGSELAMHLGRVDDVLDYGRRCLEIRRHLGDVEGIQQCASTVRTLLARLDKLERLVELGPPGVDLALLDAAFGGDLDTVNSLLARGGRVDAVNEQGRTPLVQAADQGHTEVVRLLLARGADPNHADMFGQTPLHVASWQGHLDAARALLDGRADPERRDVSGNTPLMLTATENQPDVVRALVLGGAWIDATSPVGHTALMKAAMEGEAVVVRVLLELGADATLCDSHRMSAADWAAQEGFAELAGTLRSARSRGAA